ncbi:hypothetical protein [Paenibacillus sp. NPDC093718]|uniref:hypothetical protein n=1 Tax=Paenibacillus sp. NPDC093718 TaxID=3390601 RepID=UPI003D00334F
MKKCFVCTLKSELGHIVVNVCKSCYATRETEILRDLVTMDGPVQNMLCQYCNEDEKTPSMERIEPNYTHNGMIYVPDIELDYRGFVIRAKLDMGDTPWQVNGNCYRKGYVVVKDGCNPIPGSGWFHSIIEAKAGIDIFLEVNGDVDSFHRRWSELRGLNRYFEL